MRMTRGSAGGTGIRTSKHEAYTPAICLLSFFVLAGCGHHKDTIVGKWQITNHQPAGTVNTTVEFTADGKETITAQGSNGGLPMNGAVSGAYTVSGTNLTQRFTKMTMNGRSRPLPPMKPGPDPFTLDGDHLTLTDPSSQKPLTLTRVKK